MNILTKLLEWLSHSREPNLGANTDTRSLKQAREEDILADEVIATAAPVEWKEIEPSKVRVFGEQNQRSKSNCVAESRRKIKRILFNINKGIDLDFSSVAFYRKRSNYPYEGMIAADAIKLDSESGMTLDKLVPSDAVTTESAANALMPDKYNDDVAKVFAVQGGEIVFTPGDLETPAGTIQKTRKGVMMWFYFTSREWSKQVPTIMDNLWGVQDPRALKHSVVGIEPALYKGQRGVWIDDSAHFGGISRRFITEDFYKKRNWYASYPMAFKFEPPVVSRPTFIDGNVVSLQLCLKHEGVFPSNVAATGVYGPLTTQAVKDFQGRYGLVKTGLISDETRAKLHHLYP